MHTTTEVLQGSAVKLWISTADTSNKNQGTASKYQYQIITIAVILGKDTCTGIYSQLAST